MSNGTDSGWPDAKTLTLGARIKLARMRAKMSQDVLGDAFGISRNAVSLWESNETYPETKRLLQLPELLHCPAGWLLDGQEIADAPNAEFIQSRTFRQVPLISRVPGGVADDIADPYVQGDAEQWLSPTHEMSPHSFALRVHGQSMEPTFPDGCVIFVDAGAQWRSGDYVVVRFEGSVEATFKRIVRDGDKLLLVPLNAQYPTTELSGDFTVCGVVREARLVFPR